MAQLDNVRRIVKEDYDTKFHGLIDKLAYVLNSFMEQTTTEMNGNLDFTNLNQDILTFKVKVNSSGVPVGSGLLRTTTRGVRGFQVVKAFNRDKNTVFPTSQPFISFKAGPNSEVVKIINISGLTANDSWELTLVAVG